MRRLEEFVERLTLCPESTDATTNRKNILDDNKEKEMKVLMKKKKDECTIFNALNDSRWPNDAKEENDSIN